MIELFIATSSFGAYSTLPMKLFSENNIKCILNPYERKLEQTELVTLSQNSAGIIAGTEKYDRAVISGLPNLKVISRLGVGMDNIDLVAAREQNIKVYKTTTTPAPAVAELVLGLMIAVSRHVSKSNQLLKSGTWKKERGTLLYGKTLGIIGLGTIGKTLVKLVDGFNFEILAYDLFHDDIFQKENNITYCNLSTLLKKSDIVSVHLNLSDQTENMMNKQQLALMKPDSIFINASRGEIVDENALYEILKDKKILGAGLDVFKEEPYSGPLTELDNVVLTPHIGSYAEQIRIQMETEAAENIIKGLQDE